MSEELKPCPFCGGKAKAKVTWWGSHYLCCRHLCMATDFYENQQDAIDEWNRIAIDKKYVSIDEFIADLRMAQWGK